jgi:hypothetical protein
VAACRHHLTASSIHQGLTPQEIEQLMLLAIDEVELDPEAPSATLSLVVSTSLSLVVAATLSCRSGSSIVAPCVSNILCGVCVGVPVCVFVFVLS